MNEICPQCGDSRVLWSWNQCPRCKYQFTEKIVTKYHFPIFSIISIVIALISFPIGILVYRIKSGGSDSWGFGVIGIFLIGLVFPAPFILISSVISFIRHERPFILSIIALLISFPGLYYFLRILTQL